MLTTIDLIFVSAIIFIYTSICPPLFMLYLIWENEKDVQFPMSILSFCLVYTYCAYTMVISNQIFIKSMGYGLAVSPLIIISNKFY